LFKTITNHAQMKLFATPLNFKPHLDYLWTRWKNIMRKFDISFRNDLRKKVETIENASGVELVVAILPRATRYTEYYMGVGIGLSFLVLTAMMFLPAEFWYVYIYGETVGTGLVGAGLMWVFPGLLRLVVGKKKLSRNIDMRASATFQKARIYETRARVGVLLLVCWLERKVKLVPDKGVAEMVPPDELDAIEAKFHTVFKADDPAQTLLNLLDESKDVFAKYIPPDTHPINELPDELWID
jgi:putative membrane protein